MQDETFLVLLGVVASVIVYAVKFAYNRNGVELGRVPLTWAVMGVSFVLGLLFHPVAWPALPVLGADPAASLPALVDYIAQLTVSLGALVGTATVIYNLLLKRVLDGLANRV